MTESTTPRTDRLNELLDDYADSLDVNQAGFFAHPDSERRAAREALIQFFSDGMPKWQSIETAPKGGGADLVTDPAYVDPPEILLFFPHRGLCRVGQWDAYYATGGGGEWMSKGRAWMEPTSGENLVLNYDEPTHWMSLPEAPK